MADVWAITCKCGEELETPSGQTVTCSVCGWVCSFLPPGNPSSFIEDSGAVPGVPESLDGNPPSSLQSNI